MIVECYSADVYCDAEGHPHVTYEPRTFVGPSKRSTNRQRREAGWKKVKGKDICPDCVKKLKRSK